MVACMCIPGIACGVQAVYTLGHSSNLTGTFHMVISDLPFLGCTLKLFHNRYDQWVCPKMGTINRMVRFIINTIYQTICQKYQVNGMIFGDLCEMANDDKPYDDHID